MDSAVADEIVGLHRFFEAWFRGELGPDALGRLDRALAADFVMVSPDGVVRDRRAVLDAVGRGRGAEPELRIWIRGIASRARLGRAIVVTYEEWQRSGKEAPRGRISTVVFESGGVAGTLSGLRWGHVHETWLPRAE